MTPTLARRLPLWGAMLFVLGVLITLAMLRWQAPMIGAGAVGVPLVLVGYLRGSGQPPRVLAVVAVVGAALGLGWALVTGDIVAHAYDVALGEGVTVDHTVRDGLIISVGGALVMLAPAILAYRLIRDPLTGSMFGALGATSFTVVTTLTRLAPQLATGVSTDERSAAGLLAEAAIQGVAVPVLAAAVGAMVGAAAGAHRRRAVLVVASVVGAAVLYGCLGLVEAAPLSQGVQVGVHLGLAALAVLAARTVLRTGSGDASPDLPRKGLVLPPVAVGVVIAAAVASAVSLVITPAIPNYRCPPDCGQPPIGTPVATNPRYTAADGSFSVSYPGPGTAYRAELGPDGVTLDFGAGDTGTVELFGEPANGRTPRMITEELLARSYPNATVDYEIPNAAVGYQPGYGVFADDYPQDSTGTYTRLRIMVMVAVKNDLALVASAIGPYHEFSPSFGIGHPSGANLQLAMDIGKYVNSFRWRGDPPR